MKWYKLIESEWRQGEGREEDWALAVPGGVVLRHVGTDYRQTMVFIPGAFVSAHGDVVKLKPEARDDL
jgi:hypothetical protein